MSVGIQPDEVLEFWLGTIRDDGSVAEDVPPRWWKKDPDFDAEIEDRFGPAIRAAEAGELDAWTESPRGLLAVIVLLDQFTRNTRRGRADMYAADDRAQALVRKALARGDESSLRGYERYFLYMPLMHSESLADQNQCVELFRTLAEDGEPGVQESARSGVDYAIKHRDIVARFGRFPHRNEILGRESSDEEREFLTQPGSSF